MIVVTGGAGFIGANIVKALNARGRNDVMVVDDLRDGTKFVNLADCTLADYLDKDDFLARVKAALRGESVELPKIDAIFHEGACSDTTEWDGHYMMENNFEYSKVLLNYCEQQSIPFLYASSAATYGGRDSDFIEAPEYEGALNVYGYSKQQFDNYVRRVQDDAKAHGETLPPITGFRYFNVYGPREQHKGSMASVAYHLNQQILNGENPKLFEGSDTFKRDFVYVGDVCQMNIWFWQQQISGIFNCGTGRAEPFSAVANAVIAFHDQGEIEEVPFPDHLKGRYQAYTQADLTKVREAGYTASFKTVAEGVAAYLAEINR